MTTLVQRARAYLNTRYHEAGRQHWTDELVQQWLNGDSREARGLKAAHLLDAACTTTSRLDHRGQRIFETDIPAVAEIAAAEAPHPVEIREEHDESWTALDADLLARSTGRPVSDCGDAALEG